MKRAIVIGASSGMGYEIARRLIADGWTVGLAARRLKPLEHLLEGAPQGSVAAQIDICGEDAEEKLSSLIDRLGGVDLFFQVSGIGKMNTTLKRDIEIDTVSTNAMGFTRMVGQAYRYMATHGGGHIAVISSIAGLRGLGASPSYSATKAFQHNYIQALEQQATVRHLPIKFTEIRPGFVDTPFLRGSHFPLTMPMDEVVDEMLWAVKTGKHQRIIDWKYRWIGLLWRLVPSFIYRHMNVGIISKKSK